MPTPVAFGITDLDVGGAEKTLVELVCRLDRRRWAPSVVCLQPPGELAARLVGDSIPLVSLDMRSAWDAPRALVRWKNLLRKQRPALLQTFLFHANLLGRFAARWAGVPHVLSGVRVAERRQRWPLLLDRWTRRLVDRYVCVSSAVRDFTVRTVRVPTERTVVIPNGVDVVAADRAVPVERETLAIPADAAVLLFVGRLERQKGADVLLDALARLAERQPLATSLRVLIVGEGPQRRELEGRAAASQVADVVRFVGRQADVYSWLAAADGLVLPSRWEGMANVVLEAFAARRPVIVTDVEGMAELVHPGENGWLVPAESPERLAEAIVDFLQDAERRCAFGRTGRALVEAEFTYEKMTSRYEALYASLIR